MNDKQVAEFERTKEGNFAISPPGIGRFRVNAFIQQGKVGMVLRTIPLTLPTIDGLGLPQVLKEVEAIARRHACLIANVFHAGDGNLHPLICFDSRREGELQRALAAGAEIMRLCLAVGGSIKTTGTVSALDRGFADQITQENCQNILA